ncbi:MAG: ABC transporter permease subunit [Lachnospiraceae bacterium]
MTLFRHECKMNYKNLLIWSLCIGAICFGCILLYGSLEDSMAQMSDMFAQMGAFSAALGMDKVNIGTLEGYYATEIAIMLSLGGAMFAAMTGAGMVAKEEEGHTSEFLNTLPLSRTEIILKKYAALVLLVAAFQAICMVWIQLGFVCMGESPQAGNFWRYHGACLLMQIEIGTICFLLSAIMKKRPTGAALGMAVLLYMVDLLCRVVPALENAKYITPFYFSNASDIFSEGTVDPVMAGISGAITVAAFISALIIYNKRDLMV